MMRMICFTWFLLLPSFIQCYTISHFNTQINKQNPSWTIGRKLRHVLNRHDGLSPPPSTSVMLFMSSVMIDDHNNMNNNHHHDCNNDHTIVHADEQRLQPVVIQEQQQPPATAMMNTLQTPNHKWMNSGLTISTVIAIIVCLLSLDTNENVSHITDTMMKIPMNVWEQYSNVLLQHPIATKACTSATVYTIGDIIAQRTTTATESSSMDDFDYSRVVRSMMAGLIGHGPMSHGWYNICDSFFANTLHISAWWVFIPKVIIDQTIWGPIWNNTYLLLIGLMKRESLNTIYRDIQQSTIPMILSGLKLWPAAHLITYGLIPVENRLLWVDMVEIIWVIYLSKQAATLGDNDRSSSSLSTMVVPNNDIHNNDNNNIVGVIQPQGTSM